MISSVPEVFFFTIPDGHSPLWTGRKSHWNASIFSNWSSRRQRLRLFPGPWPSAPDLLPTSSIALLFPWSFIRFPGIGFGAVVGWLKWDSGISPDLLLSTRWVVGWPWWERLYSGRVSVNTIGMAHPTLFPAITFLWPHWVFLFFG